MFGKACLEKEYVRLCKGPTHFSAFENKLRKYEVVATSDSVLIDGMKEASVRCRDGCGGLVEALLVYDSSNIDMKTALSYRVNAVCSINPKNGEMTMKSLDRPLS